MVFPKHPQRYLPELLEYSKKLVDLTWRRMESYRSHLNPDQPDDPTSPWVLTGWNETLEANGLLGLPGDHSHGNLEYFDSCGASRLRYLENMDVDRSYGDYARICGITARALRSRVGNRGIEANIEHFRHQNGPLVSSAPLPATLRSWMYSESNPYIHRRDMADEG